MAPEVINSVIDHLPENFGLSVSGSVEDFSTGILKRWVGREREETAAAVPTADVQMSQGGEGPGGGGWAAAWGTVW